MVIHTDTHTSYVILTGVFLKHRLHELRKHGVIDQGKYKNGQVNISGWKGNIMFKRIPMLRKIY